MIERMAAQLTAKSIADGKLDEHLGALLQAIEARRAVLASEKGEGDA